MTAKEQRNILKEFRRQIALVNGIAPLSSDQPCDEDCRGNCRVCRLEIRWLDEELNRRAASGQQITLAGITLDALCEDADPAPKAEVVEPVRSTPDSGSLLDMPLEELDLSLRTRVSLEGHGVTVLRQLLAMSPSDCRKVRNMTQEGLEEIEYQLGLMGLSLQNDF